MANQYLSPKMASYMRDRRQDPGTPSDGTREVNLTMTQFHFDFPHPKPAVFAFEKPPSRKSSRKGISRGSQRSHEAPPSFRSLEDFQVKRKTSSRPSTAGATARRPMKKDAGIDHLILESEEEYNRALDAKREELTRRHQEELMAFEREREANAFARSLAAQRQAVLTDLARSPSR